MSDLRIVSPDVDIEHAIVVEEPRRLPGGKWRVVARFPFGEAPLQKDFPTRAAAEEGRKHFLAVAHDIAQGFGHDVIVTRGSA